MAGVWDVERRSSQLDAVLAALDAGATAVAVVGPPGVGKTTFGAQLHDALAARGERVEPVTGSASVATLPLLALARLLEGAELGPDDPLAALRHLTAQLGGDPPAVVLADDAHLLDPASAALLHQLVAAGGARIVTLARPGAGAGELQAWATGPRGHRVDLPPLDATDIRLLVEKRLGSPLDGPSARRLHAASGGNPLFVRELVEGSLGAGHLRRTEAGVWILSRTASTPLLVELVADRIEAAGPEARQACDLLAMATTLPVATLVELTSPAAVEAAEAGGLVVVDPLTGDARLVHAVYAEVLSVRTSTRRRELARRLSAIVKPGADARPGDHLRAALLLLEAGEPVEPEVLAGALTDSFWTESAAADALLAAGRAAGVRGVEQAMALALLHRGQAEEAVAVLRAALDRMLGADDELGDDGLPAPDLDDRVPNTTLLVYLLNGPLGDPRAAIEAVERVRARVHPSLAHKLTAYEVLAHHNLGAFEETVAALDTAIAGADAKVVDETLGGAQLVPLAHAALGRFDDAARSAADVRAAMRRQQLARKTVLTEGGAIVEALVLMLLGDLDGATAALATVEAHAIREGAHEQLGTILGLQCRVALSRGDVGEALRLGAESLAQEEIEADTDLPITLGALAEAAAFAGDLAMAERCEGLLPAYESMPQPHRHALVTPGFAWADAARGHLSSAVDRARAGLDATDHHVLARVRLLHVLARLGRAEEASPRLDAIVDRTSGWPWAEAAAAHVFGLAAGDHAQLAEAGAAFAELGFLLLGAECHGAAAVCARTARLERAATAAERATADLLARCPGASLDPVPTVLSASGGARGRVALSPRELEVARLASTGKPSKEIAAQLHLSSRTVDNLLQRAYTKLGVSSRLDLPDALKPLG